MSKENVIKYKTSTKANLKLGEEMIHPKNWDLEWSTMEGSVIIFPEEQPEKEQK